MEEKLIIHEFKVWQNPQCDPIIEFVSNRLFYYFKCWNMKKAPKEEDYLGLFHCKNVERIRYINPYENYPYLEEGNFKCYYYEVHNSIWLQEWIKIKKKRHSSWKERDSKEYKHFILMTRDSYIEIICNEIEFQKIKKNKSKLRTWNNL